MPYLMDSCPAIGVKVTDVALEASVVGRYQNSKRKSSDRPYSSLSHNFSNRAIRKI